MQLTRHLKERGHVLIRGALPSTIIEKLHDQVVRFFEDFERQPDPRHANGYARNGDMPIVRMIEAGLCIKEFLDAVRRSHIARVAGAHFGDGVYVRRDSSLARYYHPGNGYRNALPLHQDIAAGQVRTKLTCWIPLVDCGEDRPGLEIVDRPIREELPARADNRLPAGTLQDAPTVRPTFKRGDAVMFFNTTVHRTYVAPGMSEGRHSLDIRFMPHGLANAADGDGLIDVTPT